MQTKDKRNTNVDIYILLSPPRHVVSPLATPPPIIHTPSLSLPDAVEHNSGKIDSLASWRTRASVRVLI